VTSYDKPLPEISEENGPFWEGARNERLLLQRCARCGHLRYPISRYCPECLEEGHEWVPVSGRGEVYSSVVFHQVYNQAFAGDVPYNVSLIQLDEGPRMFSNVVGVPPNEVRVGDRVQVVFDRVTEEVTIPRFTPEQQ
jgi:uncharacterized OB-fold protein